MATVSYGSVLDSDTVWRIKKRWIMTPDYQTLAASSGREGQEMGKPITTLARDSRHKSEQGPMGPQKREPDFPWGWVGSIRENFDEEPMSES